MSELWEIHEKLRAEGDPYDVPAATRDTPVRSKMQRMVEFLRVTSGPKVDSEAFELRLAECTGCDQLVREGSDLFCGGCGCGNRKAAELKTKLWWERLKCPLQKF